tara:strand:+ start:233 stop:892 length:660 start_codon:yes stop_codon:yes gene_type:complete
MKTTLLLIAASICLTNAIELTPDTWGEKTAGKTVFVKFFAPWCGHCKKMKPAWDNLMKEYENHDSILVADVDCIGAGKDLCSEVGVKGFPTVKHGDPSALEDYQGGRDEDSLKAFAKTLKPSCSLSNKDVCDSDELKTLEEYYEMSVEDLEKKVQEGTDALAKIESDFKSEIEKLQAQYQALVSTKESQEKDVKTSGLGAYQKVLAFKQAEEKEKKDEL